MTWWKGRSLHGGLVGLQVLTHAHIDHHLVFRSTIWPVPGNSSPLESPIHGPFDKGRLGLASYMYLLSQKHGSWYPCLYFVLFVLGDHVHVRLGITWSLGLPTQRNLDLRRYPVNISIKYPHLVHFFCLGNHLKIPESRYAYNLHSLTLRNPQIGLGPTPIILSAIQQLYLSAA